MDRIRIVVAALFTSSLLCAAPLAAQTAKPLPAKGEPPLTAQTMVSGGVRPPEQLAMRFDSADLSFEILPDTEELNGIAVLDFTAKAPLARLVIDLDRNLPVKAITIDGCSKTRVILDEVLSSCETVNCKSIKIQIDGTAPSVAIDKTDGIMLILARTAMGVG